VKVTKTERGFDLIEIPAYTSGVKERLIQQSSAMDDTERGMSNPGSSFLWVGSQHHLCREEIEELIRYLERWLKTGRLKVKK
jgi:hypothetical protein